MDQKSVYSKLSVDAASTGLIIKRLQKNRPDRGLVQVLKITEKQYGAIIDITGNKPERKELDDESTLVVL